MATGAVVWRHNGELGHKECCLVTCSKKDGVGGWRAKQSERDALGREPQVLTSLWKQGPETRGGILVTGKVLGWRYQCMVSVKISSSCPIIQLI